MKRCWQLALFMLFLKSRFVVWLGFHQFPESLGILHAKIQMLDELLRKDSCLTTNGSNFPPSSNLARLFQRLIWMFFYITQVAVQLKKCLTQWENCKHQFSSCQCHPSPLLRYRYFCTMKELEYGPQSHLGVGGATRYKILCWNVKSQLLAFVQGWVYSRSFFELYGWLVDPSFCPVVWTNMAIWVFPKIMVPPNHPF